VAGPPILPEWRTATPVALQRAGEGGPGLRDGAPCACTGSLTPSPLIDEPLISSLVDYDDDYDPDTLRGCLCDIKSLSIALVGVSCAVVVMWHLIGLVFAALLY